MRLISSVICKNRVPIFASFVTSLPRNFYRIIITYRWSFLSFINETKVKRLVRFVDYFNRSYLILFTYTFTLYVFIYSFETTTLKRDRVEIFSSSAANIEFRIRFHFPKIIRTK